VALDVILQMAALLLLVHTAPGDQIAVVHPEPVERAARPACPESNRRELVEWKEAAALLRGGTALGAAWAYFVAANLRDEPRLGRVVTDELHRASAHFPDREAGPAGHANFVARHPIEVRAKTWAGQDAEPLLVSEALHACSVST